MSIKTLVDLFDKIQEKITPDMIGGEFFPEEKILLLESATIQNKWKAGKAFLKKNQAQEAKNNGRRVYFIYHRLA